MICRSLRLSRIGSVASEAGVFLMLCSVTPDVAYAQGGPDARYRTRPSDCRHEPPPGASLPIRRTDSGIIPHGYTAERVLTLTADASRLQGGDILVCTEYGRVEITDSDDDQVRLQVRMEGLGEGSARPNEAAARVIDETILHTFITEAEGRLMVRVWHSTLGFTTPGGQPAFVSIRLQIPGRGAYRLRAEAFHGTVAARRLTLAAAILRGNVGDKFKGIPGFLGGTELDNVTLAGDVDIDNLARIPGIRPAVAPEMSTLAAPILIKARVASTCRVTAVTGGNINIAIQPAPELGVRALGESNAGRVTIMIDGAVAGDSLGDATFRVRRSSSTAAFETKRIGITVRASSGSGSVNIASVPAAPLARPSGG